MTFAPPAESLLLLLLLAGLLFGAARARGLPRLFKNGAEGATGGGRGRSAPPPPTPEDKLEALMLQNGVGNAEFVGDLRVVERVVLPDGMLVRGSLTLADDAQLCGSVVVHGNVLLGERARCEDPLLVHGNLEMCRDACVPTARVEGEAVLARGARVEGTLECEALFLEAPEDATPLPPDALLQAMERLQRQT